MIYRWILRGERVVQRLRRRVFTNLPQWAKDAMAVIKYVNFLKLEPTLSCLFFSPQHFYGKLESAVKGKTRYLTPVACLTSAATLIALLVTRFGAMIGLRSKGSGSDLYYWILAVLTFAAITAPLWSRILAHVVRFAKNHFGLSSLIVVKLTDGSEELILSKESRKAINRGLYVQGLLYFTVFFAVALPVVLAVWLGILYFLVYGLGITLGLADDSMAIADPLQQLLGGIAFITIAILFSRFVIQPLSYLFRSSLRVATLEAMRFDLRRLRTRIEKGFAATVPNQEKQIPFMRNEWTTLAAKMRQHEVRVGKAHPELLPELLANRASACLEIKGLVLFLDDTKDFRIISILDKMCAGHSVGTPAASSGCS
jgi:hypothetical protein